MKPLAMPPPNAMCVLRKPGPLDGRYKVTSRYVLRRLRSNITCVRLHCFTGAGSTINVDIETFHHLFKLEKR